MRTSVLVGSNLLFVTVLMSVHGQAKVVGFEDVIKEMLAIMQDMTTTLETVTDQVSAGTAKPVLRKVAKRFVDIRRQARKMKPPTPEEKQILEKAYKAKLQSAQLKLFGQIARVKRIEGGQQALEELKTFLSREAPSKNAKKNDMYVPK